jgi:hypothetical protein
MSRSEGHVVDEVRLRRLSPTAFRAVRGIGDAWGGDPTTVACLLDMTGADFAILESTADSALLLTPAQFYRASLIIAIYRALGELFAGDMAERWPSLPNRATPYDGRSPIDFMASEGTNAMIDVLGQVRAMGQGL